MQFLYQIIILALISEVIAFKFTGFFYTPVVRPSVGVSVHPFTIVYEHDNLKTACQIDFTFWYDLNITKTLNEIDLGHSTKTKMAATAVWRLALDHIQDISCERDILKTACQIDFTFWYCFNITKTSDAIDLGHSPKTKMATTAVWRLTLYHIQDIPCERDILKTACQIINSHFDKALRPRTLLILGILWKPRWPPQQFED